MTPKKEISDLTAVHMTKYFPVDMRIRTRLSADAGYRDTLHFTINDVVQDLNGFQVKNLRKVSEWGGSFYAILIPFDKLYEDASNRILNLYDEDTFLLGDVELPEGSIILTSEGSEQERISAEEKGIRYIEVDNDVRKAAKEVLEQEGYDYCGIDPVLEDIAQEIGVPRWRHDGHWVQKGELIIRHVDAFTDWEEKIQQDRKEEIRTYFKFVEEYGANWKENFKADMKKIGVEYKERFSNGITEEKDMKELEERVFSIFDRFTELDDKQREKIKEDINHRAHEPHKLFGHEVNGFNYYLFVFDDLISDTYHHAESLYENLPKDFTKIEQYLADHEERHPEHVARTREYLKVIRDRWERNVPEAVREAVTAKYEQEK